jgi:hypothetical protein
MTDEELRGIVFISNNGSDYIPDMMQYAYNFKFAGPQVKDSYLNLEDESKSCLRLICRDEFKRGERLRIFSVSNDKKTIYTEYVNDSKYASMDEVRKYKLLTFLSMRIGVSDDSDYTFVFSDGVQCISLVEALNKGTKFYGAAVLLDLNKIKDNFNVVGTDKNTGTQFEWIVEQTFTKSAG